MKKNPPATHGRLKGTLLPSQAEALPSSSRLESLRKLGIGVEFEDTSAQAESIGPAEIIHGVSLTGLVHISDTPLEKFSAKKVGPNGKFGTGTYFAAGALEGETYSLLSTPGNVLHEATTSGTVLLVDRTDVKELDQLLKERSGAAKSVLKTSINNAPITDDLASGGINVDAVVVFMDQERTSAEVVVLPHAVDQVHVTDTKVL